MRRRYRLRALSARKRRRDAGDRKPALPAEQPKARSGGIPRGGLPVGDGMFRIVVAVHGEKGAEDSKARIDDTRDASKNFVGGARNGIDLLFDATSESRVHGRFL